ncbi:DUF3320 domain-containing protein [Algoriella sp.]|uniref:DUF3320 domain-containing protein n=1 Tax=Algoriella sp. TaxID=1872434 RepID=UPI001B0DF714|nr:DUF3320 domain-containing protein [Algoriella sp.]MBO6213256.1 DUF3320 domain-containing protein [Algoriella sp.]
MINQPLPFQFTIQHHNYINYTFCLNNYNFLTSINFQDIQNDLEDIQLIITSNIGLFEPLQFNFDRLQKNIDFKITQFDFVYDLNFLKSLSEKDLDQIQFKVIKNGEIIAQKTISLEVLPIDYFGGLQTYPELLASYVLSNNAFIYKIKTDAIKILETNNLNPSFEGYQTNNKERVLQLISSIYKAIQNYEFIYSAIPPSFEKTGQRIRLIDQVIETKFGNCIDISLIFAACLEAINLNPLLVVTRGHAFVGVWLENQRFDGIINYDQAAISKRIASGIKEIALIEATNLCKGSQMSFTEAMKTAEVEIMDLNNFLLSIDIKNARSNGIGPLPLLKTKDDAETIVLNAEINESNFDKDFEIGTLYQDLELTDLSNLTKQKIWERKLLDLSLRNNLLNLRFTKSMLQLVDLKVNLLEDHLADGKTYTIHPNNNQAVLKKYSLYHDPIYSSQDLFKLADDEFKYNKLLTYYHQDDLDTILTHLFRTAKLAEEENGKSTLYLGIGLLKWFDSRNKDTPRFAPILLIPVELSRKSVNSKFMLRSREEETMINITLLEYLRQEYKLNLSNLETLPTDDSGVDVAKVLAIIRNAVLNLEGWDVLDQTVLGTFSFNKLILWQDISKYAVEIQKSAIVKSLIDGKLTKALDNVNEDTSSLEHISSSELILPIPTDNSQLNAVLNANQNKSFILHGPPGTGKSQTITNIIADALANNKKVLFVAAKKAALDVVHSRLEGIGLGPFCLELHSNKSKKSDVLQQFERTLEVPKYQIHANFESEAIRIDERKKELSKYVIELHQKFKVGWSLYDSISHLEANNVQINEQFIVPIDCSKIDNITWNSWKDWLIPFASIVKKIGEPSSHSLKLINIAQHQFENKGLIVSAINTYIDYKNSLLKIEEEFELNNSDEITVLNLFEYLKNNQLKLPLIDVVKDEGKINLLKNWILQQNKVQLIENELNSVYNSSILNLDYENLSQIWNKSKLTWFFPKWLKQRKVKAQLNGYVKSKIESAEQVDQLFDKLNARQQSNQQLNNPQYGFVTLFAQPYFEENHYSISKIEHDVTSVENALKLGEVTKINAFPDWLKNHLNQPNLIKKLAESIVTIKESSASEINLLNYLSSIPETNDELENIVSHISDLEDWVNYNVLKEKATSLNLDWFIKLLEKKLIKTNAVDIEFENIIHLNYFVKTVYNSEVLNSFDATIYESYIQQYKDLHKEFTTLSKNQLVMKLSDRIPNLTQEAAQSSEIGILQKAIRSKGRGLSIRKLFDQIPTLIPRLKPCMLMSPISVAQYFDVNTEHFDLVIFDEASQLPTSEAISALARAKQAIIVGDPKQMPPTSFFASAKIDEDNIELEDLESILDDCLALSIPSNYLLRHYRSKHESLISFSNVNFYDNKLLTFPSPDDLDRKVTFKFIEGFYDKGKTRTNKNEAEAIINYIFQHLKKGKTKSIGVVTFSQTQQVLIEDLLQKLFQTYPQLEEFSINNNESIFIKNLENVQGDERDIILFSIGYGPDEDGKVSMNFGPLNRDGGWRRLNVAVTRARYEMKVFSSLRGDQIDLNRTNSEGVKGLKNFLNFAEKGIVYQAKDKLENEKTLLIKSIADYLILNGLNVKTNIGTSDYKIDIGVVDEANENDYILAILIDSDNYFKINTTNDRELLAPNVLKNLGWNIYRIWTLDWLKNKEKIVDDIKEYLVQIKKEIVVEVEQPEVLITIESNLNTVEDLNINTLSQPYVAAILTPVEFANSESIYFPENRAEILNQMRLIITTEAPISQNSLFKKILKNWNTSRAGSKLNGYLSEIINSIPDLITTENHQKFYWTTEIQPNHLDYYRDNLIEKRTIDELSIEEISVAIQEIMEANLSLEKIELIRFTARIFNFSKVGAQIDIVINLAIDDLQKKGNLIVDGNRIILNT